MIKINDKFTYPEELDLSPFLHEKSSQRDNCVYTLHSIVVHQGTASFGHYFAYIRCSLDNNWILFNDEVVKQADKHDVFENSYGGYASFFKHKGKGEIFESYYVNETSAYILVYIRNSRRMEILNPITEQDVSLLANTILII